MHESSTTPARFVRFGDFVLDVRARELAKSGARLNVPEQPLQVLEALLATPGEVVTRDALRQRLWGEATFVDFEHGLNAAVKRLRDVLGDSADAPQFIETVPRRGYRFICPSEPDPVTPARALETSASSARLVGPSEPHQEASSTTSAGNTATRTFVSRWTWRPWWVVLSAAALLVSSGWWLSSRSPVAPPGPPARVVPLTSLGGFAIHPTFSPDGEQVAFAWSADDLQPCVNYDIYVTIVGSMQVRRLTDHPGADYAPRWSPDGRQIALIRDDCGPDGARLRLMSALGGSERALADFTVVSPGSWSPDGRYIAVARAASGPTADREAGIWLVPTQAGAPRALTKPVALGETLSSLNVRVGHRAPAFSPDGRRLAYVSCPQPLDCHVETAALTAELVPVGSPLPLTSGFSQIRGVAWSQDGTTVIFDEEAGYGVFYLWRVDADGRRPAERMEISSLGARWPATSRVRDRLAFTRQRFDTDIDVLEHGTTRTVITSSFTDFQPAYSPDGQRIAFCSSRSGDRVEVWVSAADGSGAQQLTHGPGRWQCSPHWSPDGRRIVFDSRQPTGLHVWVVDADGGIPRQLTNEPGTQAAPTWSQDGQWVYYAWFDGKTQDIWRRRLTGEPPERITRGGAAFGMESADGQSLVYVPRFGEGPLLAIPLSGGPARQLVKCVGRGGAFALQPRGLYYVPCPGEGETVVRLLDAATGQDTVVGSLGTPAAGSPYFGLAVAPDGTSILFTKEVAGGGADLTLIEDFK